MGTIRAQQLAAAARSQLGQGDDYVPGGEHGPLSWPPRRVDCSGFTRVLVWHVGGKDLIAGTSETQWAARVGGVVPDSNILLPGDLLFFVGGGSYPPPGHTGVCVSFDHLTGRGIYISAYDSQLGVVAEPFVRHDSQWIGATRVANAMAEPPAPALKDGEIIARHLPNGGQALCNVAKRSWQGIKAPQGLAHLLAEGFKQDVYSQVITPEWWSKARQVPGLAG